jgi:hypothetical protein
VFEWLKEFRNRRDKVCNPDFKLIERCPSG